MNRNVSFLSKKLFISQTGIKPLKKKVEAISNCPIPENISQLKSYLGMTNFYSKFIPMLSSELAPLYKLLKKNQSYFSSKDCEHSFVKSKKLLVDCATLSVYNPKNEIVITADSSTYGIWAILLSQIINVELKPVLFVLLYEAEAAGN